MKKWLLVLGMITCIFGLTACGSKAEEAAAPIMTEADANEWGDYVVSLLNQISTQQLEDQYADDVVVTAALASWNSALEDMGSYVEVTGHSSTITAEDAVINIEVKGTEHDANVEILLNSEDGLTSITTNVKYSFGELMEKAGLNTLLGMGTVFCVLILISFIISSFGYIPKIQEKFTKKSTKEDIKAEAVDNTIAQIIQNEELSDDLELVAVIAAAVAASNGASSTDGFVVRSIKRANTNKWQRA